MVIDGHVMLGRGRDVSLSVEHLLATMDRLGIDQALVSPAEGYLPVRNDEGNELTAAAAAASGGRLLAYAVATPWLGADALEELRRARDAGARALKLDSALQGFDLLDGQAEPLIAFAIESGWPVYVRTGTPPHALPLQVAWLAARFPEANFLLGKAGATDFSHDGPATLEAASNVYADSVYVEWPTALAAADPQGRGGRVFFSTDAPFGDPVIELARVTEAPYGDEVRDAILGGTLARLLGL
jgi:predicted TIM-barrel fold metal-dependent hydrolase